MAAIHNVHALKLEQQQQKQDLHVQSHLIPTHNIVLSKQQHGKKSMKNSILDSQSQKESFFATEAASIGRTTSDDENSACSDEFSDNASGKMVKFLFDCIFHVCTFLTRFVVLNAPLNWVRIFETLHLCGNGVI